MEAAGDCVCVSSEFIHSSAGEENEKCEEN